MAIATPMGALYGRGVFVVENQTMASAHSDFDERYVFYSACYWIVLLLVDSGFGLQCSPHASCVHFDGKKT